MSIRACGFESHLRYHLCFAASEGARHELEAELPEADSVRRCREGQERPRGEARERVGLKKDRVHVLLEVEGP